ncbi:glucosamine-6-phosphate deaminase [Planococcus shenhongbingii]|uniref:Glucosamine-6-phosphate deaminase n=1 Tax=Planococcus shenhongbingii TaxID=3058398 RepID=A0ABT8NE58_9BACL|nr:MULTISPECIES: glucosamine-6-phosphate deaminase [unclassified Planococcus (in: firmicutes)]MDN7246176.1 glucosamine-6-phosphate deaminase [Planococcus sp. N017]WKA59183.1 glucosamine-6-phosphate deaminase [Planococcus sp. N016]
MNIEIVENYDEMSKLAAEIVEKQVVKNPRSILGLATGSTPMGLYSNMIEGFKNRGISYKQVRTINLDEYLGLNRNHPNSYHSFMHENLFKHLDIQMRNTYLPEGQAASVDEECMRYEALLDRIGPVHLQILGMGTNGHIGFNEPGTPEDSLTHCIELDESTRNSNARFFDSLDEVPTHAITMGIESILKSDKILLLVSGKEKAQAVKMLMEEPISEDFPASFLWKHEDVTFIVDQDAYHLVETERQ